MFWSFECITQSACNQRLCPMYRAVLSKPALSHAAKGIFSMPADYRRSCLKASRLTCL